MKACMSKTNCELSKEKEKEKKKKKPKWLETKMKQQDTSDFYGCFMVVLGKKSKLERKLAQKTTVN